MFGLTAEAVRRGAVEGWRKDAGMTAEMDEGRESAAAPPRANLPEADLPKAEHPRPDFHRDRWLSLNGRWDFAFEDISLLRRERAGKSLESVPGEPPREFDYSIVVPFCHQSELARLRRKSDGRTIGGDPRSCEVLWYRRGFTVPEEWKSRRILLHFEAVDYQAGVWLNGQFLRSHRGGHVPFTVDLGIDFDVLHRAAAESARSGDLELIVRAYDPLNPAIPRGKQAWESPDACWYSPCSGIWQSVWLEAVPEISIRQHEVRCRLDGYTAGDREDRADSRPDNRKRSASLNILLETSAPAPFHGIEGEEYRVEARIRKDETPIVSARAQLGYPQSQLTLSIPEPELWSPEHPALYDVDYRIYDARGECIDEVHAYLGIRSLALSPKGLILNGRPYFQRLVLDQGFWPDGRYTAPSDADLRRDIELAKAAGFNGCRKHMKVEEARFLYWADKLGFLVWGEFPAPYVFNAEAQRNFLLEWPRAIERDRIHPSIAAWVPYNESWGIGRVGRDHEQQDWARSVYELTRRLDPERPIIDNDGWEHVVSDIYTYHTYANRGEELAAAYTDAVHRSRSEIPEEMRREEDWGGRARGLPLPIMADGIKRPDMPVLISEFGGIGYKPENKKRDTRGDAWGYNGVPETAPEFKARFEEIMKALYACPELCGFCYTQLTDVDQEINGILTFNREPKFNLDYFREWFGRTVKTQ